MIIFWPFGTPVVAMNVKFTLCFIYHFLFKQNISDFNIFCKRKDLIYILYCGEKNIELYTI